MNQSRTSRAAGLFWSLALGMGLTMGLVWALSPDAAVEAQDIALDSKMALIQEGRGGAMGSDESAAASDSGRPAGEILADAPGSSGSRNTISSHRPQRPVAGEPLGYAPPMPLSESGAAAFEPLPAPGDPAAQAADPRLWESLGDPGASPLAAPSRPLGILAGPVITFSISFGNVTGYTDPDSGVHLLLWDGAAQVGEARTRSDSVGYFFADLMAAGRWAEVQPGNTLDVVVNSVTTTLAVPTLTGVTDPGSDTVSGIITGTGVSLPTNLLVDCWGNQVTVIPDGSGAYTASMGSLIDINWTVVAYVSYQDANGNWLTASFAPQNGMVVRPDYAGVSGYTDPGALVTVTVDNGSSLATGTARADLRDGWWWVGLSAIGSGDLVTAEVGGGEIAGTVSALTADFDLTADQVTGTGPANSQVTVCSYLSYGLTGRFACWQVPTDGGGGYTADFAAEGLHTWTRASVCHHETPQADTLLWRAPDLVNVEWTWNQVSGYFEPGAPVTATLEDGSLPGEVLEVVNATASPGNGYYWAEFREPFQTGYRMTVEGGGVSATVELATLNLSFDLAADTAYGDSPPSADLMLETYGWYFGPYYRDMITSTASSDFDLDLSALLDVHNGRDGTVYHPEGSNIDQPGWQSDVGTAPFIELNVTHDGLSGWVPGENVPVTLTLMTGDETVKGVIYGGSDTSGDFSWQQFRDEYDNVIDIEPADQVVVEIAGWTQTVVAPDITTAVDPDTDQVSGMGPADSFVEVRVRDYWPPLQVPTDGDGYFLADFTGLADIQPGTEVEVAVYDDNWNRVYVVGVGPYVEIQVNYAHDWVEVGTMPGAAVTITVADTDSIKATLTGQASGSGWLGSWEWDWDPKNPDILPGDMVTATADGLIASVDPVGTIDALVDMDADTVSGTVNAPWFPTVTVRCEAWTWGGPGIEVTDVSGDGGDFFCDFAGEGWDIQPGPDIAVRYIEPDGDSVINMARSLNLFMSVNYGHDWVEGYYEPGYTLWLTITESDSQTVKATAQLKTQEIEWWGGATGFSTNLDDPWLFGRPDIQPGDWAFGRMDNGYTSTVRLGTITGELDIEEDTISGTITADWFTQTLNANCGIWEEGGPGQDFEVDPDGGSYFCDFGSMEWDLQPGHDVGVQYMEPDGDWVINVFEEPVPDLSIQKGTTSGPAVPGGTYLYRISYYNGDNGVAENTVITDVLPLSTTYFADTSGFSHTGSGSGPIVWDLGAVPPHSGGGFYVALNVDDSVPVESFLEPNYVVITTTSPGDNPENNQSDSGEVWVDEGEMGVWVNKGANPGDPHPGQQFAYFIEYGSDGGAASGPVWLTDTLPLSTTFVGWQEEQGWEGLWTEVITTGDQFVLQAPAGIPGDMGGRIRLTLLLDPAAQLGTMLENTVVITTAGDVNPDNNWHTNTEAQVSGPRYDMRVDKWFNNGVLVPGGWIDYGIAYQNQGNTAVHAWLTDTLPPGTTYQEGSAGRGGWDWWEPLPPLIEGDKLIWDLGMVEVNEGLDLSFRLNISSTAPTGTVTNCATVGIAEDESTPDDNTACVDELINDPGPNLRVKKYHDWYGDGRLYYQIQFQNLGTETVSDVWITDTLPLSTTWDNWWDMDFDDERLFEFVDNPDRLQWHFSELYPGDSGWLYFEAAPDERGVPLRWYTNTVEITIPPGEVTEGDNRYDEVAFSGGEVKWVDLNVGGTRIWGQGYTDPVTVTTPYTWHVFQPPEYGGGWFDWDFPDPFQPGDIVTVEAGAGMHPVIMQVPDPFTAYASSITDTVWGQIDYLDQEWVNVDLSGGPSVQVQTDGGQYSAPLDVPRGGEGEVRYSTAVDYADVTFHRGFRTLDLILGVDYGHDWVAGNYEAGHTVWLTVTESDGETPKATAVLTTGPIEDWGNQSGFSTDYGYWIPGRPDIQVGDFVHGLTDSGYTSTVQVGSIEGELNVATDFITGTLNAPWPAANLLTVRCEIHEPDGDSIEVYNVNPEGGIFFCDFGGRWDIQPGHNVAINYREPDNEWVQNHLWNPVPHLRVEKWANGHPSQDGNLVFQIQYRNEGGDSAENTLITDTMIYGLEYITDTSGFSHTGGGSGPIVWDLGTVEPGDWIAFEVFADVTATEGEIITNVVQIGTSNPFDQGDPGEKESWWWDEVQASDTQLSVGKSAWTGDPAPGEDLVYAVNVCNGGSTDSSQLTLTDTLHPSMTLLYPWFQHPGWTVEYSDDQHLVVSRPSIPSFGWCTEVYLRVHLDAAAWPGMYITNTAVIAASNNQSPPENTVAYWEGNVGSPHVNLWVGKYWSWGQLVPGGELHYGIGFNNNGNMPVAGPIQITDTLPVSTTFNSSWQHDEYGQHPFTPTQITDSYVVWTIDGLDAGYGGNFEVVLDVDPHAPVGTILTNAAEISPQPNEDGYDDNLATAIEVIRDHGPNLRLRKDGQWNDEGENTRRAQYYLTVENVGDVTVNNVVITDTYPAGMGLEGDPWTNYWRGWDRTDYPGEHYFTVTFESLYPGDSPWIAFNVITDTAPLPFGMIFTNTAEVMRHPDEPTWDDNRDSAILTTGPDLFVDKSLVAGELLPGELVTFSLVFGNKRQGNEWWWSMQGNAWLTDTLPAGLEYITSTLHWCGEGEEWCSFEPWWQDGTDLVWQLGPLGSGDWNEIYLTTRITDTATGQDTFTNWLEIASDQPISDTEPYLDNNLDSHVVIVAQRYIFLPLVLRQ